MWNVQVFRSVLIPPFAAVGFGDYARGDLAFHITEEERGIDVVSTKSENVSEALVIKESALHTGHRSMCLLSLAYREGVEEDDEDEAPPQALRISNSIATREKDIIRKRGLGFLGMFPPK